MLTWVRDRELSDIELAFRRYCMTELTGMQFASVPLKTNPPRTPLGPEKEETRISHPSGGRDMREAARAGSGQNNERQHAYDFVAIASVWSSSEKISYHR